VLNREVPTQLLERVDALALLEESLSAVKDGSSGRLVLVAGEAGVGKTALLRRFSDEQRALRILWGSCDPLFTPRPLGPLLDIAELLHELELQPPTIVVLEDLHYADEATLDVLRLVGRRIESSSALALVSYRDDELEPTHPLRIVLGELATSTAIQRLKLEPLSPGAVEALAESAGLDAEELYRRTAGNPFFVTEALGAAEEGIPATVRDAVLARSARLSPGARAVLEAVAVSPPHAELWLLAALAGDEVERLGECLSSGMLTEVAGGVAFRHELARLAVEDSIEPARRVGLHERALGVLAEPPSGRPDPTRLAHHADAAADAEAVLRYAPAAAKLATSLGAHREAAAQYARALRFADGLALGELLELRSSACFLTGQFEDALEAQAGALESHRSLGDRRKEGDSLRALSRLLRYVGRTEEAWAAGRAAVEVLESLPAGRELALAYCNLSYLYESAEDDEGSLAWGTRALELAERLDEAEPLVYALINIGATELLAGNPAGQEKLSRSLELAQAAGLEELAGRAYVNHVWWAPRGRSYALAEHILEEALEYCTERGLDLWRLYLLAYQARSELDRGRWDEAVDLAGLVIRDPRATPVPTIWALSVLGLVRARRGDPETWPPLDEAWALAEPTGELQRIEPPAAARAEALGDRRACAMAPPRRDRGRAAGPRRRALRGRAGRRLDTGRAPLERARLALRGCPGARGERPRGGGAARPGGAAAARRQAGGGDRGPPAARAGSDPCAARSASGYTQEPGRAYPAGARGARSGRRRAPQRRDRSTPLPGREDRRPPRLFDPPQARRANPRRGRRGRGAARARPRSVIPPPNLGRPPDAGRGGLL